MRQLVRIGAIATPRRLVFLVNNRRFFSSDPVRRTWSPTAAKAHFGEAVVPQQSAWVIERFGKFYTILTPGFHFLIPIVDRVAYCRFMYQFLELEINLRHGSMGPWIHGSMDP